MRLTEAATLLRKSEEADLSRYTRGVPWRICSSADHYWKREIRCANSNPFTIVSPQKTPDAKTPGTQPGSFACLFLLKKATSS